ncbi:homoserine O- acetyltransferase [Geranomyces michiganensis]|nr:homoserine O- acetyltransferase [Geranomyces michiganensis]
MAVTQDSSSSSKLQALIPGQSILRQTNVTLELGGSLTDVPVAYKTWGKLNAEGTNAMVVCHALSGSADVEDWWGPLLGSGKAFDPDVFFVFCGNVLGSPYGTASPITIDPETGRTYGPTFPSTTVRDDVRLHKAVLDSLGVRQVQFAIGGSMGGMQVLEWAFFGPEYVRNIVPIATSGRHSAWCISWGESQRQSIYSDPNYADGNYPPDKAPTSGLAAARMQALLTYRSRNSFESRFGRKVMPVPSPPQGPTRSNSETASMMHNEGLKPSFHRPSPTPTPQTNGVAVVTSPDAETPTVYSAQSYLRYQGDKFIKRFDANCYISITRKMDTHDISRGRGEYHQVLASIRQPTLVIGIETDGLFTIGEQRELADHIPDAQLEVIESPEGHDGFLLEFERMNHLISAFIRKHAPPELYEGKDMSADAPKAGDFAITKTSVFGEAEDALMW